MELNSSNYFDYRTDEGVPVLSSSMLKVGTPVKGGSPEVLEAYYNDMISKDPSPSMAFGSLLHAYFEDKDNFVIEPEWTMSNAIKEIVDRVAYLLEETDQFSNYDMTIHSDLILQVCVDLDWNRRYKPETKINTIKEATEGYWKWLIDAKGKKAITGKNAELVNNILKSIEDSGKSETLLVDRIGVETFRELAIKVKIDGKPAKILLDILEVDDQNKLAIITDYKSTSHRASHFMERYTYANAGHGIVPTEIPLESEYSKYMYYFQEYFYKMCVNLYLKSIGKLDYRVEFEFAVLETKPPFAVKTFNFGRSEWYRIAGYELDKSLDNVNKWFDKCKYLEF